MIFCVSLSPLVSKSSVSFMTCDSSFSDCLEFFSAFFGRFVSNCRASFALALACAKRRSLSFLSFSIPLGRRDSNVFVLRRERVAALGLGNLQPESPLESLGKPILAVFGRLLRFRVASSRMIIASIMSLSVSRGLRLRKNDSCFQTSFSASTGLAASPAEDCSQPTVASYYLKNENPQVSRRERRLGKRKRGAKEQKKGFCPSPRSHSHQQRRFDENAAKIPSSRRTPRIRDPFANFMLARAVPCWTTGFPSPKPTASHNLRLANKKDCPRPLLRQSKRESLILQFPLSTLFPKAIHQQPATDLRRSVTPLTKPAASISELARLTIGKAKTRSFGVLR